jgi:serine/threonine-protein kinase RsbW
VSETDTGDSALIPWADEQSGAGELQLRIPPDPTHIRIVRLATSGLASMADFDLDGIEDLKIAVDEVCSSLIEVSDGAPIELRLGRVQPSGVWIEGRTQVAAGADVDSDRVALGDRILEVIVDRHELVVADGSACFRVLRLGEVDRATG